MIFSVLFTKDLASYLVKHGLRAHISMESDGPIKGVQNRRKRVYVLTEEGKRNMKVHTRANGEIHSFLRNLLVLKD